MEPTTISWTIVIDRIEAVVAHFADADLAYNLSQLRDTVSALEEQRPGALQRLWDRPTVSIRGADFTLTKLIERSFQAFRNAKRPEGDDSYACRAAIHCRNLARACRERIAQLVQERETELQEVDGPVGEVYSAFNLEPDALKEKHAGERAEDLHRHRQKGRRRRSSVATR